METVNYRYFPLHSGDRVLDLGCGEGRHVLGAWYGHELLAVGVDYSREALKTSRRKASELPAGRGRLGLLQGDGTQLPFADQSFDRVICSEVLEHIPDYRGVLAEIARVLRPGGLLCISVPRAGPERLCWWLSKEYAKEPGGHIRIFDSGELERQVQSHGFRCYRRHYAHALHSPLWWLKCLFWRNRERAWPVRAWHAVLVWDLLRRPRLTRWLEQACNPFFGKSVVLYFRHLAIA